jgi:hypothetical protein
VTRTCQLLFKPLTDGVLLSNVHGLSMAQNCVEWAHNTSNCLLLDVALCSWTLIQPIMNVKTFLGLISIAVHWFVVTARPDGSPVCTVGSAAPQSLHLIRQPGFLGEISVGNFNVKIGDTILKSGSVNKIPGGTNLVLDMRSTDGSEFRGVLIILNKDGLDLSSNLMTSVPGFKEQGTCHLSGYSGFTHANRDLKQFAQANITMPINQKVFLDVNIVVANNFVKGSIFYHTRFQLSSINKILVPVKAPVRVPAPTPITLPIKAPIRAPMKVPITAPVRVPIKSPVTAPLRVPVKLPIRAPIKAPVSTPIRVPI